MFAGVLEITLAIHGDMQVTPTGIGRFMSICLHYGSSFSPIAKLSPSLSNLQQTPLILIFLEQFHLVNIVPCRAPVP